MDSMQPTPDQEKISFLDVPIFSRIALNWQTWLFIAILIAAIVSRFYILGARVMSHDETSHVYFSWLFEQGRGYKHDPVTHGPLQFHLMALSYFLFGDSDFSARLPHALFSIAGIAFMWNYRCYLGRFGWSVAALLLLISPYMLYYGRYARNESLVALFGIMMFWAMLRYFESGAPRYLYWFTAATVLHFITKETSYIYTAQALVFLALYFISRLLQTPWPHREYRNRFLMAIIIAILLLVGATGVFLIGGGAPLSSVTETVLPAVPGEAPPPSAPVPIASLFLAAGGVLVLLVAVYFLIRGYTLPQLRAERSLDLLILLGTLVLPFLAAIPVKMVGWNPLDYTYQGMLRTGAFLIPIALIAIGIGLWWNPRLWLGNAALYYSIYTVFYTTVFTNGAGFFTGMVGSLGYWLVQQSVNRGSQPWYYYAFVQIPIYEYLPALGTLLALGLAFFARPAAPIPSESTNAEGSPEVNPQRFTVTLLGFWMITSLLAYSYAGEKMPWLTVHIALPMILLSGWSFSYLIESIDWVALRARRGIIAVALLIVFLLSLTGTLGSLLGSQPPFQGKQLEQLQATSTFLFSILVAIASGIGLVYLTKPWPRIQVTRLLALTIFAILGLLTARTALAASFINYDYAIEYLVYAHSAPGSKLILAQVEDISKRTTDGLDIVVAYDDVTTYPFWWYLRNYRNARFFGANPTRDLREAPIIIVGDSNFTKIEPVVTQAFYPFDYIRMWWPSQDYWSLKWGSIDAERRRDWAASQPEGTPPTSPPPMTLAEYLQRVWTHIQPFFTNPAVREAVWEIWFNRDFTKWGALKQIDTSLPNWQPSASMRMYLRKDLAAQIWNYGVGPSPQEVVVDPYEGKEVTLNADNILGLAGAEAVQFKRPRDLAFAPDGTLYVADTDNHRIQHLDRTGRALHVWGSFADIAQGTAPTSTFYEPWGIAVGPDGSVYVADTWNHRIQKFTATGEFIKMWGYFGQAERPDAFWGPRDVVVDSAGRVLVTDTGNKRIVIFDADGNYINQFGSSGFAPGQFNEPVGLALDADGNLYVADTWNQRIQSFAPDGSGSYLPLTSWDVSAWFGQSLDNKPYLAVDEGGHVFATDPEGYRILEFTSTGEIVRFWGDYSLGPDGFGLAGSITVDPQGGVWVSDAGNSRIMHFNLPEE